MKNIFYSLKTFFFVADYLLQPIRKFFNEVSRLPYRKHVCNVCFKSYKHEESLYTHKKYECDKPKQFKCFECNVEFSRPDSYRRHLKKQHADDDLSFVFNRESDDYNKKPF